MSKHRIEEHVKVYLRRAEDGDRWEIDPIIFDGYPLDGLDKGAAEDCGDLDDDELADHDEAECAQILKRMREVELPTGGELFGLLAEALGVRIRAGIPITRDN